jgi:hypothetical protein
MGQAMKYLTLCGLVIMAMAMNATAQSVQSLIEQLQSTSPEVRIKASQYIYGGGIENAELYAAVADAIEKQSATLYKNPSKVVRQEVSWHAKALASSGNMDYMPLLDKLSKSSSRSISKHANNSKTILAEAASAGGAYLEYRKVRIITASQAKECEYISQQNCSTLRSLDKCIDKHKAQALRVGANSIMVVYDDNDHLLWKSGMMADYYKCNAPQMSSLALTSVKTNHEKPEIPSYIDELKALASLRDDGIITEEEFQKQKAEILARE